MVLAQCESYEIQEVFCESFLLKNLEKLNLLNFFLLLHNFKILEIFK